MKKDKKTTEKKDFHFVFTYVAPMIIAIYFITVLMLLFNKLLGFDGFFAGYCIGASGMIIYYCSLYYLIFNQNTCQNKKDNNI